MTPTLQTLVHGQIVDLDIQQTATGFNVLHAGKPVAMATTYAEAKTKLVVYAETYMHVAAVQTASFDACDITLSNGETRSKLIAALCCGPLAYHPTPGVPDRYTVTHIASGLALFHLRTEGHARRAVELALASPLDWTQDQAYFAHPDQVPAIRALEAAIRHIEASS